MTAADGKYVRPRPRTKYAGVYMVRHRASGRGYIGGSTDITGRFTHHRFMLRRGRHKSWELQEYWDRYGEHAFEFVTLERCEPDMVRVREQAWHDATPNSLNTLKAVFNNRPLGPSSAGSRAALRRWAQPEYRRKREGFLQRRRQGRSLPASRSAPEAT